MHPPICWSRQTLPGWDPKRFSEKFRWMAGPLSDAERAEVVGAIVGATDGRFGAREMDQLPNLKAVSVYGVGTDHVDLAAAAQRSIIVSNTPDVVTDATAELALLLILASVRELTRYDRYTRQIGFPPYRVDSALSREVRGKTVGLLGYGRIGQRIASLLAPLHVRILYYQRRGPVPGTPGEWRPLDALARESQILVVVLPLTDETRHLVNHDLLSLLPEHSYLVNVGRGPVVDEDALVHHLQTGHLAGAGLDVFEREPDLDPRLLSMDQVVLSPHRGTSTYETRRQMTEAAVRNLVEALTGTARNRVI